MKAKADETALKMVTGFKCSKRWLQWFKDRWNITWQSASRGASADIDSAQQ
jgi:predicted 3-demethylubiquinone-9 3-methyltransferase (glyoxalase superfamily)